MCANLALHGPHSASLPLLIHNRTVSRCEALRARLPPSSVVVAPTLAQAVAESDIIFTCLSDDAAILTAITTVGEERGFFNDKLFVDCSTVHPDTTSKLASLIAEKGGKFVACPGSSPAPPSVVPYRADR